MENKHSQSVKDWNYSHEEAMKHWRSWGSWYSWGSATGLSLAYAITLLATGVFLMMLHSIGWF